MSQSVQPTADVRNSVALELEEWEDSYDLLVLMLSRVKDANSEHFPGPLVHRLSRGANPASACREWRGMSRAALAEAAGTTEAVIAAIEVGDEVGLRVTARIAQGLRVDLDDLVPWPQD